MKELWQKYREIVVYIVVGGLTTVFCFVVLWILTNLVLGADRVANNGALNIFVQSVDWLAGVLFAYPLNRKWVFKSKNPHIIAELLGFAGSRVSTWILDALVMVMFATMWKPIWFIKWVLEICGQKVEMVDGIESAVISFMSFNMTTSLDNLNYWFVKIFISSVLVMIVNYIFSKLLIFKKKKPAKAEAAESSEIKNN